MLTARAVHHAVSLIRADQLTLNELYKYLTINETNFEFDINAASEAGGMTVLHAACAARNDELTQELLLLGANPNQTTQAGRTPLMEAIEAKSIGSVKILLAHGAKLSEEKSFLDLLNGSSDPVKQCIESFKAGKLDKVLAIIRAQQSWIKTRLIKAQIALVARRIEANIARYRENANSFFSFNNDGKANRLEAALTNAREELDSFKSAQEFLNYKKGDAESINDVLSERRIGISESTSKKEMDELVRSFKM